MKRSTAPTATSAHVPGPGRRARGRAIGVPPRLVGGTTGPGGGPGAGPGVPTGAGAATRPSAAAGSSPVPGGDAADGGAAGSRSPADRSVAIIDTLPSDRLAALVQEAGE